MGLRLHTPLTCFLEKNSDREPVLASLVPRRVTKKLFLCQPHPLQGRNSAPRDVGYKGEQWWVLVSKRFCPETDLELCVQHTHQRLWIGISHISDFNSPHWFTGHVDNSIWLNLWYLKKKRRLVEATCWKCTMGIQAHMEFKCPIKMRNGSELGWASPQQKFDGSVLIKNATARDTPCKSLGGRSYSPPSIVSVTQQIPKLITILVILDWHFSLMSWCFW